MSADSPFSELEELQVTEQDPDFVFKIVIVGDSSVGKSNILTRYTQNVFDLNSKATVGVELSTKLYRKNNEIISVNLWDTAGQERFAAITSAYYKGSSGAIIVYDITKRKTFDNIDKWYSEIVAKCPSDLVIVLVGNKMDLEEEREVKYQEGLDKAKDLGMAFMETSALTAQNINEVFKKEIMDIFLYKIKQTYEKIEERELEKDEISHKMNNVMLQTNEKKKKKGCC